MDFLRIAVEHILSEYPMECRYCSRSLSSQAFKYSEESDQSCGILVLDICCIFCGQLGQLDLEFPRLDLQDIRGNFCLVPKQEDKPAFVLPDSAEVLAGVNEILKQARSQ